MIRIFNQDCLTFLKGQPPLSYDCVFADPPDNLGLGYDEYDDKLPPAQYYAWLFKVLREMCRVSRGVVWLSFFSRHLRSVMTMPVPMGFEDRLFFWTYTFAQYNDRDCSNNFRPILRLSREDWQPNANLIREPSERMKMGDKRAAGPRVPGDVWSFPRVVGNAKERRTWHPTQHPEALMERILLMSSPPVRIQPPYRVLDCFGGTFTAARVSKRLGIDCDSCELSRGYCERGVQELDASIVGGGAAA